MSVRFTADLDQLAGHVDDARRFADDMEAALADLERLVAELHVTWTGAAAEAHRVAHAEWTRGARTMREALVALGAVADAACAGYRSAAEANAGMWGPLGCC